MNSTEIIHAAIAKERGDSLDRGILPNSQSTPVYSLTVTYVIGAVIFMLMATGVALVFMGGRW